MSIHEYDAERHIRQTREEGYEDIKLHIAFSDIELICGELDKLKVLGYGGNQGECEEFSLSAAAGRHFFKQSYLFFAR